MSQGQINGSGYDQMSREKLIERCMDLLVELSGRDGRIAKLTEVNEELKAMLDVRSIEIASRGK